jgi:hypothetical protein
VLYSGTEFCFKNRPLWSPIAAVVGSAPDLAPICGVEAALEPDLEFGRRQRQGPPRVLVRTEGPARVFKRLRQTEKLGHDTKT